MITDVPHLCGMHSQKLVSLDQSSTPNTRLLIGALIVQAKACLACNPPRGQDELTWLVDAHKSGSVRHSEENCAACLSNHWSWKLSRASAELPRASLTEYLTARAALKSTFPGYPKERTPRRDCQSTEEFLLLEGRRFAVQELTEEETVIVGVAREELRRLAGGTIPTGESRFGLGGWACSVDDQGDFVCTSLPPEDHIDPWDNFAVAQFAWEVTKGKLGYVEGFRRRHHEADSRPHSDAWNLLGEKVVDVRKGTGGSGEAEYFGCLLDAELERAREGSPPGAYSRLLPFGIESLDH